MPQHQENKEKHNVNINETEIHRKNSHAPVSTKYFLHKQNNMYKKTEKVMSKKNAIQLLNLNLHFVDKFELIPLFHALRLSIEVYTNL